ncbi:hypothetical protein VaNZ11_011167 [Volvox africanus]|uniref:Uncharacterized protein n=1 Tax=Volvox africanus TaxID=51714 RepID=A0ABQ5SBR9_9CHLO|nr:hypothetical protein VaNZ11_011167 [Volvox africanus]
MSSLDSKLDLSLDELIKQAAQAKRPAALGRTALAKPTPASQQRIAPKQVGARTPLLAATGIAGKRQAIRAKRQGAVSGQLQRPAPKILLVEAATLKHRTIGPGHGARTIAKRIVNRAVMAPKLPTAVAMRQRGPVQRPQAPVAALRPRQQQLQKQQQQPARQPRQQIMYVQQPIQQQHRQVPVSLARRMRQQRQQQQQVAMQPRAQGAGRAAQMARRQVPVPQGSQRRGQAARIQGSHVLPAPRQQQQRQMLGLVQQGAVRKNRQMQQAAQRRAPVFAGNGNGTGNGSNQRGRQQQQVMASQRQHRGGGRNHQTGGGNMRNRAPILMQQNGGGPRGTGGRGRRGRR